MPERVYGTRTPVAARAARPSEKAPAPPASMAAPLIFPRHPVPIHPPSSAPAQLSGGSSQANEELRKAMGKAATRVVALPNAKPHTKTGTGSSGTDHQARNANVINRAKQDTRFQEQDPTKFAASRMRSDDRAVEKDAAAGGKRAEKAATKKKSVDDDIREVNGLEPDEPITSEHRKAYRAVQDALGGSQ